MIRRIDGPLAGHLQRMENTEILKNIKVGNIGEHKRLLNIKSWEAKLEIEWLRAEN